MSAKPTKRGPGRPRASALTTFGIRLRDAIARSTYTNRSQFVRACGVDPGTLWRWETGLHPPPHDFLLQAASMLDVTPAYLDGSESATARRPQLEAFLRARPDLAEDERDFLQSLNISPERETQDFYLSVLNAFRAQLKPRH